MIVMVLAVLPVVAAVALPAAARSAARRTPSDAARRIVEHVAGLEAQSRTQVLNAALYAARTDEFWGETSARLLAALEGLEAPATDLGIDVGANVGTMLTAVARAAKAPRVIAVEPNPRNCEILRTSFRGPASIETTIVQAACSDRSSTAALFGRSGVDQSGVEYRPDDPGNPFCTLVVDDENNELAPTPLAVVETVTLDSLVGDDESVGLIKIDVEGHELAVLRGAARTLRRTRCLLLEASHLLRGDSAADPFPLRTLLRWLETQGFAAYRVGRTSLLPLTPSSTHYHPIFDLFRFWSDCFAIRADDSHARSQLENAFPLPHDADLALAVDTLLPPPPRALSL